MSRPSRERSERALFTRASRPGTRTATTGVLLRHADAREEPLQTVEVGGSFALDQRRTMPLAGSVPAFGDDRGRLR